MTSREEEIQHEIQMQTAGYERFMANLRKAKTRVTKEGGTAHADNESSTAYGSSMIADITFKVKVAIDFKAEQSEITRGTRPIAFKYLELLPSDTTAFITVKTIIDSISRDMPVARMALKIANKIEDQAKFHKFEVLDKSFYEYLQAKFKADNTNDYRRQKRVMTHRMNSTNEQGQQRVPWSAWPDTHKVHIGVALLECFKAVSGLIEIYTLPSGNKTTSMVGPTAQADELIRSSIDELAYMTPDLMPMLIKPLDWTDSQTGGYYLKDMQAKVPLIKERNSFLQAKHLKRSREGKMDKVLKAVSYLQSTAYEVDTWLYDIVMREWTSASPVKLPSMLPIEPAPCPTGELSRTDYNTLGEFKTALSLRKQHMTQGEREVFSAWKSEATVVHTKEIKRKSKVLAMSRTLSVARALKDKEEFYFVVQCDTRGRMYTVGTGLNPQGHGVSKALLKFKKGVPLGEDGFYHACLNLAGLYGVDKVSLQERVDWVMDNELEIRECVKDTDQWKWFWEQADKPYLFLQAAREVADIFMAKDMGHDITTMLSYTPCAQDGSCNGMQHFNAALRDREAGKYVNLTDSERPADIYMAVADQAMSFVDDILNNSGCHQLVTIHDYRMAEQWKIFGIVRDDAKKPVMVFPYGGTKRGTQAHFLERITERIDDYQQKECVLGYKPFGSPCATGRIVTKRISGELKELPEVKGGNAQAAIFINTLIWEALEKLVISSFAAMKWIKSTAYKAARDGEHISWQIPSTGFEIYQSYSTYDSFRVRTQLCGKLSIRGKAKTVSKHKEAGSASPNFIHSLDAAHLMLVLCACADAGIKNFIAVHDSYAVCAGDCTELHSFIREGFIELHAWPMFDVWLACLKLDPDVREEVQNPEEFIVGTLDLSDVLEATHLFR